MCSRRVAYFTSNMDTKLPKWGRVHDTLCSTPYLFSGPWLLGISKLSHLTMFVDYKYSNVNSSSWLQSFQCGYIQPFYESIRKTRTLFLFNIQTTVIDKKSQLKFYVIYIYFNEIMKNILKV